MGTILIFQGGGSLGAYECGVYQALAPWLRSKGQRLSVVAGNSIGAISANLIAARFRDANQGAGALRNFWNSLAEHIQGVRSATVYAPQARSAPSVNGRAHWPNSLNDLQEI